MLLRDYAITPDVFDETSYPDPSTCDAELRALKNVLLDEGLVRDLRDGEWHKLIKSDARPWHTRGKELLRKLIQQNRLVAFPPMLGATPSDDRDWCQEALGAHRVTPVTGGIICTETVKEAFPTEPLVARIDRLSSARWWSTRSSSVRLGRNLNEYRTHLELLFRCANSVMFIDPYLDPQKPQYHDFVDLLRPALQKVCAPTIEIHRVCYEGSGPNRRLPMRNDPQYFKQRFSNAFRSVLPSGLLVQVFIWDDFHDRYLITDLIGILLSNGFDTTNNPRDVTTWSRLSRAARDDVQREFHPASGRRELRQRFTVQ